VYVSVGIRVGRNRGSSQPCKKPFSGRGISRRERDDYDERREFVEFYHCVKHFGFAAAYRRA